MKRFYKNTLDLYYKPNPKERRQNISKEIICHADFLPKTLGYEDIDRAFKSWVDEQIAIIQDGNKLPTMVLYSNQRFSEYLQTWSYTDENNNVRMNFKAVTRENNPAHGTILGDTYNIPGDRFYTMKSIKAMDESGREYRVDYKMRQPTPVDFNYKVSIMTNRYTTLNEFNEVVQRLFNAKQSYIAPNGHYMSIVVDNISDESEYNIEDRQFFSQTFTAKVRGYIIREEDLRVEENPIATIICFEGDGAKRRKPTIELSEYDPCFVPEEMYYKKPIDIDVDLSYCYPCKGKTKFTIDEDFIITGFQFKEPNNIVKDSVVLMVNDEVITSNLYADAYEGYTLYPGIPEDTNKTNTITVTELPEEKDKVYKYLLYNNEYYVWHQIHFADGDEIIIQTERINRYINTGGFVLNGYNRFVVYSNDTDKETPTDIPDLTLETVTITPDENCQIENTIKL